MVRRIWINDLKVGMTIDKDIYDSKVGGMPLLRKSAKVTRDFLDKLRARGVYEVYIREAIEPKIELLPKNLYVPKPKPLVTKRFKDGAVGNLENLFTSVRSPENFTASVQIIKHLDKVVEQLVDSIENDQRALVNISDLKSYDEYTYHHSLSVAVLSIAIGQYLGLSKEDLNRLGRCAIMHDIGKTAVPIEIINKPSRLSDEEFSLVKGHSSEGYNYLVEHKIADEELLEGVLAHHEKFDGTGYPYGLEGEKIPLFGRIIAVADVYDALTSVRPYRDPMEPVEAIEYIMGGVGTNFDYDIVTSFLKKVELYPVGSLVELSNGEVAVIVDNENQMRPVVRIRTGEYLDLFSDLSCLNIVISRTISAGEVKTALKEMKAGGAS